MAAIPEQIFTAVQTVCRPDADGVMSVSFGFLLVVTGSEGISHCFSSVFAHSPIHVDAAYLVVVPAIDTHQGR
eukprot:3747436-Rhodomonas_salina.1